MSHGRQILTIARQARDAWQHAAPRRADGGIHALRGFDYQFCVFLKTLLVQWKDAPPEKRTAGPTAFTEVVSDILAVLPDGPIFVTQVKLSLSRYSLAGALDEFAQINKAVATVVPDLRFGICSPVKPSWDTSKAVVHWARSHGFSELEAHSFSRRIDIITESDPFDDCLAILANDLGDRNPVEHINELVGRLLHESQSGDLATLPTAIWGKLIEIEKAKVTEPTGVYVWTSADRPPSDITNGATLIGQQPMAHHLREGYFADREALYGSMMRVVTDWLQDRSYRSDPCKRLPVFWIGGRSGSGKSVALLHVLAAVHAQGAAHVMWLQDSPSLLPSALAWAAGLAKQGRQAIIGIDDPYSPNKRNEDPSLWSQALANFTGIREAGTSAPLPAIICCGPTEHAERFESDFVSSVVLKREDIPSAERPAELAELRAWYVKRKGHPPPALGDEDVLLVQLFFQWHTGLRLPEFSLRFKKRLEEAGGDELREVISCMLCANRLYVGYPDAAVNERLKASQLDVLDRLLKEHHISRMAEGRTGFWLTHPHLANVIYESWHRADSSAATRREHLSRVIADSLRQGRTPQEKTAPLWAISRVKG